jgi:hypothetical protein
MIEIFYQSSFREAIAMRKKAIKYISAYCENLPKVHKVIRDSFPKKLLAKVEYDSDDDVIEVIVIPPSRKYKFDEKQLAIIYDWLSKFGRWEEDVDHDGNIFQKVDGKVDKIKFQIQVKSKNSIFCKVERSNFRRQRNYSYSHKSDVRLVCSDK